MDDRVYLMHAGALLGLGQSALYEQRKRNADFPAIGDDGMYSLSEIVAWREQRRERFKHIRRSTYRSGLALTH